MIDQNDNTSPLLILPPRTSSNKPSVPVIDFSSTAGGMAATAARLSDLSELTFTPAPVTQEVPTTKERGDRDSPRGQRGTRRETRRASPERRSMRRGSPKRRKGSPEVCGMRRNSPDMIPERHGKGRDSPVSRNIESSSTSSSYKVCMCMCVCVCVCMYICMCGRHK